MWNIDKYVTARFSGDKHILDYYYRNSCEHVLKEINIPSLFLNNTEDPICYKENIPLDLLY